MLTLFDPSLGSDNLGDEIIMASISPIITKGLLGEHILRLPSHYKPGRLGRKYIKKSRLSIACGSNMLGFRDYIRRQWTLTDLDIISLRKKVLLFGVGWSSYHTKVGFLNAYFLKNVLSDSGPHSVRDEYTKKVLESCGVKNVFNTGCPTMWLLPEKRDELNSIIKPNSVVFTLTNYARSPDRDTKLIKTLTQNYDVVYFWPQSFDDLTYIHEIKAKISFQKIQIVGGSLAEYTKLLKHNDIDYIGTRLHAGIHALNSGRRAIIMAIDNRASEISKDTNLPIFFSASDLSLDKFLINQTTFNISVNQEQKQGFLDEFSEKIIKL